MKVKLIIITLLVSMLLVACGGGAKTPQAEQPAVVQPTTASAPATGEKVTIRLWSHQNPAFQSANEKLITKFMEQNPNIEVKYETFDYDTFIQSLQTSMAAGTEGDVIEMFGTWVCSYAKGGRLLEVPADVMTYDQAKDVYFKATLDGYYCNNKLYGMPNEFNLEVGGALVNPELFQAHNVAFPPKWNTFQDLIDDAVKMTEFDANGMMTKSGFYYTTQDGLAFALLAGILQQGGNYFASDGKHFNFDTPEARKTLQLLVDMTQKYKLVDSTIFDDKAQGGGQVDMFFSGRVAIGFVGSWAAGEGKANYPDMKFDYVKIPPYFGTEDKYAADSGWGKVVSSNTKYPAEAWKLASFMAANEENNRAWNTETSTIPSMKKLVDNPGSLLDNAPWIKPTFDLLPKGQFIGDLTDRDTLFYDIIFTHALAATQGTETVDEAVTNINTEANAMVDNAK
jgi:multiple sugar transport system substrate-binding protein